MLQRQYTTLLNIPIVEMSTGKELGKVYDLIIDDQTGKIEGFWVSSGLMSGSDKMVSINDVADWKIKIYIDDPDSIIEPDEIVKIKEILERNIYIYLNKVKTISEKKLGKVIDIFFDPISNQIIQIQIAKNIFGFKYQKRLIPFSEIYKITKKAVILKNDYKTSSVKLEKVFDLSEAV